MWQDGESRLGEPLGVGEGVREEAFCLKVNKALGEKVRA